MSAIINEPLELEGRSIYEKMELKELLSVYMKYYEIHAEQRTKILNLFSTVEPALIGGYVAAHQLLLGAKGAIIPLCALSLAISMVAFVVWCMDVRTTDLLHQSRVALRMFEERYESLLPVEMRLFTSIKNNESKPSFSHLVRGCYKMMMAVGLVFFVLSFIWR